MADELIARLATIAGAMNGMTKSADAELHFDLLAGALWWSDERPKFQEAEDHRCLHPVFRFRTTLILDSPEMRFLPYWEEAQRQFPKWPGFATERCSPNDDLAELYRQRNAVGLLSLDLMDIMCRLKKEFVADFPSKMIEKHAYEGTPPDIQAGDIYKLICRAMRLSGNPLPTDAWEHVRGCIANSLGRPAESITDASWLVKDLGAGGG